MKVLFASTNAHKIQEMTRLFRRSAITLVTVADVGVPALEVMEDGLTFEENALKKARAHTEAYRIPALADDSGICVDILAGAPGVRSARFGRPTFNDAARTEYLLASLDGVPSRYRGAHYVCVLALTVPNRPPLLVRAACYGHIAQESVTGPTGFGYDPVFILGTWSHPVSQMTAAEKDVSGHRGKAVRRLLQRLPGTSATSGTLER